MTHPADVHADAVGAHLDAWAEVHRHDTPELAALPVSLHLSTGHDSNRSWGRIGEVELAAITCVWQRRPSEFTGADTEELQAGVGGILATLPHLNHPADVVRAAFKPLQLVAAQQAGLDVPCTTITTSTAELESAAHLMRRVVVKALSPGRGGLVTEDDRSGWGRAMHLTQSRIEPDHHVQVAYVDGEMFGTRIDSPHLDWRTDRNACRCMALVAVPGYYRDPIHTLLGGLGLRLATLEFVADRHGRWWFVSLQPDGDWLWSEQATGQPISAAVARALATPPE